MVIRMLAYRVVERIGENQSREGWTIEDGQEKISVLVFFQNWIRE